MATPIAALAIPAAASVVASFLDADDPGADASSQARGNTAAAMQAAQPQTLLDALSALMPAFSQQISMAQGPAGSEALRVGAARSGLQNTGVGAAIDNAAQSLPAALAFAAALQEASRTRDLGVAAATGSPIAGSLKGQRNIDLASGIANAVALFGQLGGGGGGGGTEFDADTANGVGNVLSNFVV